MQIDYALILSAGLGTRMGEIGKKIPKVMWPIFNKKIIDLQIDYCRDLGIKKIFINTHYLSEVIKEHIIKNYHDEIVLLHEETLLNSGGAIHNLAEHHTVNYTGNLLMVNGDQFLFIDENQFQDALIKLRSARAVLFGIKVDKATNYNETKLDNGRLTAIEKKDHQNDFITYSGLGLLKLDGLKKVHGISTFFETVANFKNEEIQMLIPDSEYWDFGTAPIYFDAIKKVMSNKNNNSRMNAFLRRHNVDLENSMNFYNHELESISLENVGEFNKKSLTFKDIVQEV